MGSATGCRVWRSEGPPSALGRPTLSGRRGRFKDSPEGYRGAAWQTLNALDPEHNDLKALVAYAVGKGIIKDTGSLRAALDADMQADPLYFLAAQSGKTFGEKYAPLIASFWFVSEEDGWIKKKSSDFYDVGWLPSPDFHGPESA